MNERLPHLVRALYVHVPFCARKCSYCAFYSDVVSRDAGDRYVAALIRELESLPGPVKPITVFFGGGTPSVLTTSQWQAILSAMDRLGLLGAVEWTIECNPATVGPEKACLLRSFGVNRISMGVQSLDDALLDRLGRIHTREMVFRSFDVLREAGFDNINLDLMFAIPGQTLDMWSKTLDEVLAMQSEHVSSYEVIYEEDTPLFAQLQAGKVEVDEDLACDMYDELVTRVSSAGFQQYEIANFARNPGTCDPMGPLSALLGATAEQGWNCSVVPSRACLHNVNYWRGGSFYGVGPSATSYVAGERWRNWPNTDKYCELIEGGQTPSEFSERLNPVSRAGETAAFGLRMVAGWGFRQFESVTGFDLRKDWAADMELLVGRGWGEVDPEGFRLTSSGLRFADAAAQLFLR